MTPNRKRLLIGGIVVVLLIGVFYLASITSTERENISKVEQILQDFLAPMQKGAKAIAANIGNWGAYLEGIDNLRAENEELRKELSNLRLQLVQIEEYKLENERLSVLLNVVDDYTAKFDYVTTSVINREPSEWYKQMTINGGSKDGFAPGMPVICAQGLVGRIISTSEYNSTVLLLTDRSGAVSAMVQNTRTIGVVEGDGETDNLSMIHVPYDAEIENYQQVLTSGYGGIYPQGLLVGYINNIDLQSDGLMLNIDVRSYVDFAHLEEVIVLMPKNRRN